MTDYMVDITPENAQAQLIDESHNRLVVVDFWADWCEPCKNLMPVLEKLAKEYEGTFLLAKVNADEQQMIASQFGVQSLPTVMLIQEGKPVDGFMGAQSEKEVRELLEKYLPKPWEPDLQAGHELLEQGQAEEAYVLLRKAFEDSGQQVSIGMSMCQALIELNRLDQAEAFLETVKMADQDSLYQQLVAKLELARNAAKTPEITQMEEALSQDPENMGIAYQLALKYSQNQGTEEALKLLLKILKKDVNYADGAAKKSMLDILTTMGKGDPLAAAYQRQLFTLLY